MAAPLAAAAKLLIKPILNQLKKAAIRKAAETGAAKTLGLGVRDITKLTNLDVLNLVRAKAVKGAKAEVAKSLGITVKELNATLADITLTETRKNAVKGHNYIKNANRFLKDPIKTIGGEGKRKIAQGIEKEVKRAINPAKPKKSKIVEDEIEKKLSPEEDLLEALKKELNAMKPDLAEQLNPIFSAHPENLNVKHLFDIIEKLQRDQYYAYKGKDTVVQVAPEGRGGGYKMGYEVDEYMETINQLLLEGFSVIKDDSGLL